MVRSLCTGDTMATVVDHPLVAHKLSLLRDKNTKTAKFRRVLTEIAILLAYEATRALPTQQVEIETPLARMQATMLVPEHPVVVSVLRAGNGFLDGFLQVLPSARVGFVGLARDHDTHEPVEYYVKFPGLMDQRDALVVDPMLATGGSAVAALERVLVHRPRSCTFICLVAAPEGIARLEAAHPSVNIVTAAIDERLDENAYIVPGLGDAGDRLYGT
ncbi:MAG: uracil phosphoribosyltransferase [Myxococcota bacterium]|jgi:uracil phosphoribosyltransferase